MLESGPSRLLSGLEQWHLRSHTVCAIVNAQATRYEGCH